MVHKRKLTEEEREWARRMKAFGVDITKELTPEQEYEREKKEWEKTAKEATQMYETARRIAIKGRAMFRKGKRMFKERFEDKSKRRPIAVYVRPKDTGKKEIVYGEW
jgi:hypothetical protein